jgi:hypothetical protein
VKLRRKRNAHPGRRPTVRRVAIAGSAFALLALPGCGDDDDAEATADLRTYCESGLAIEEFFGRLTDLPTAEQLATIEPTVDAWAAAAPEAVADAAAVSRALFESLASDPTRILELTPEQEAAFDATYEHDLDACGVAEVPVTAADYSFAATLPSSAGPVAFELTNDGKESHVFVVARLRDGQTGTAEDAFASIEDEAGFDEVFESVTSVFADPGTTEHVTTDLASGSYLAFCPIPLGSVPGTEGTGPPHFTEGMVTFFDVD